MLRGFHLNGFNHTAKLLQLALAVPLTDASSVNYRWICLRDGPFFHTDF